MPQCEPLNTCHMSRVTLGASKNVKFRLSRNSTKFDVVTRFRETILTVKPVSSSEIKKIISDFDRNYHFTLLSKIRIFLGFHTDMKGCQHPHDDPLVIRAIVANKTVHRVLIDNGSSVDIIFASAFDKMGIKREKLETVNAHLLGFSGKKVLPLGSVQLVLTLGEPPY